MQHLFIETHAYKTAQLYIHLNMSIIMTLIDGLYTSVQELEILSQDHFSKSIDTKKYNNPINKNKI